MTSPQDREWREVVVALDIQQERFNRATAEMRERFDAFRDDLAAGYSEMIRANQEHARRIEADRQAWLAGILGDEPTQEPAQHRSQDAHATPGPGTVGAGRTNPHAADLELAEDIADMDMATYAARRADLRQTMIRTRNGMFS
jgi:hypothetical protein